MDKSIEEIAKETREHFIKSGISISYEFIKRVIIELEVLISNRKQHPRLYRAIDSLNPNSKPIGSYLSKYESDYEANKISKEELEWATNYWLDNYPLNNTTQ